ncbi:hypothetical protein [Serratia fonticola]|uniref:hypothetical protein n=1 Tax=Serratia fonticola TaxID=47917 RepID=UPI0016492730|nr:hypothetical protein [Serratia fonticola]MBC3228346.1 hypothetical protein [Serratia fonticola]
MATVTNQSLQRRARVERIIKALSQEFSEDELNDPMLAVDLWLAMQLISGPEWVATVIGCGQVNK